MSNSVRPHRRQPTRLPRPWDSPGKNAGVGCHFLLQCMKVKSESEVTQSCLTLSDPMDCSLPGSSIHVIFQARVLEWGAILCGTFHGVNVQQFTHPHTDVCSCPVVQLCLTLFDLTDYSPPGSSVHGIFQARILEWVAMPSSRGSSQPRDQTHVSCVAGRSFTTEPPERPPHADGSELFLPGDCCK